MRNISKGFYLCGLGLIFASLVASGCATRDAKRNDETYKRPTQAEKQQTEPSTGK